MIFPAADTKLITPPPHARWAGTLRQLLPRDAKQGSVVAVTSCRAGDGTSTVAADLAIAGALESKHPVLLVDLNFEAPSVSRRFALGAGPGLTEALESRRSLDEVIHPTTIPTLHVLTRGNVSLETSEAVQCIERFGYWDQFREQFSLVVLDLPPVLDHEATTRLAATADCTLLVLAAERSSWAEAYYTKQLLLEANVRLLGAVLNQTRRRSSSMWRKRT